MNTKTNAPADYDVWYKGRVIANVKACSQAEAEKLAKQLYTKVERVTKTVQS